MNEIKWTDELIESELTKFMTEMGIERMPTHTEFRENKRSGLAKAISENGGSSYWLNKLNLKRKPKVLKWNDEEIEKNIKAAMKSLQIERMPSSNELKSLGRNDLHCAISKSGIKYSGWANKLGIELKISETYKGNKYEYIIKEKIERLSDHLKAEKMSTGHPYDLLINKCVKVDVKVSSPNMKNGRVHTFGLNKVHSTCDIYVCVALDEADQIERIFIIPSPHVQIVTLCVGEKSKYNKYIDNWDFIVKFTKNYEELIAL